MRVAGMRQEETGDRMLSAKTAVTIILAVLLAFWTALAYAIVHLT